MNINSMSKEDIKKYDKNIEYLESLFEPYTDQNGIQHISSCRFDYVQALEKTKRLKSAEVYPITASMTRFKIPNIAKKSKIFRVTYVPSGIYNDKLAKYVEQNFFGQVRYFEDNKVYFHAVFTPYMSNARNSVNSWIKNYYDMLSEDKIYITNHFKEVQYEIEEYYDESEYLYE